MIKPKMTDVAMTTIEQVATTAETNIDATVNGLKDGMAKAAGGFEQTQEKMKLGVEKAMKTAEDMVAFSQGNFEAFMKSSQIWAAGMQDLSKQFASTAQASVEETISTVKALTSVRSFKDAVDLQSNLARSTLEKTISESGRLTDASFKLTEQAMAPLTARVTMAVEKFAKTA